MTSFIRGTSNQASAAPRIKLSSTYNDKEQQIETGLFINLNDRYPNRIYYQLINQEKWKELICCMKTTTCRDHPAISNQKIFV
jgi:hypothetical protein